MTRQWLVPFRADSFSACGATGVRLDALDVVDRHSLPSSLSIGVALFVVTVGATSVSSASPKNQSVVIQRGGLERSAAVGRMAWRCAVHALSLTIGGRAPPRTREEKDALPLTAQTLSVSFHRRLVSWPLARA